MLTAFILVAISLVLVLFAHLKRLREFNWLNQFDGPSPTLPFFGNTLQLAGDPSRVGETLLANLKNFGITHKFWGIGNPILVTADPELAKIILSSKIHLQKSILIELIAKPVLGNGLITSDVDQWRPDRKILNPVFNHEYFESSFNLCLKNWSTLEKAIESSATNPMECQGSFKNHFLTILLKSLNSNSNLVTECFLRDVVKQVMIALDILNVRGTKPWTKFPLYWRLSGYEQKLKNFHTEFRAIVCRIIDDCCVENVNGELSTENAYDNNDLTSTKYSGTKVPKTYQNLLRDPNISFDWKYDQILTLIGAGVDTVSIATTMTLFFLALNPECQKKAHEEVDSLFYENTDEALSFRDISKMNYLRMCSKEAMRLHPPAPVMARKTAEDILMDDGRQIPIGTSILFLLQGFSMNPDLFPDPYRFDPERFSEFNSASIKSHTYMPFSVGPRNCIGQKYAESILLPTLAQVLRIYTVCTQQKAEDIKIKFEVAGTPYPKVQLIFKRRQF